MHIKMTTERDFHITLSRKFLMLKKERKKEKKASVARNLSEILLNL